MARTVVKSLRTVEEAVRDAGKYSATDLGVELMRNAFDANTGPLTDMREPLPKRQALAHLFAEAIGYYKNAQSHRTVGVNFAAARDVAILGSHLLRIVDDRRS